MIRIITATELTLILGFILLCPCSANSTRLSNVRGLPALFYLRVLRHPLKSKEQPQMQVTQARLAACMIRQH